jgi:hypothetical protein
MSRYIEAVLLGCEKLRKAGHTYLLHSACSIDLVQADPDWLRLSNMQMHACARFRDSLQRVSRQATTSTRHNLADVRQGKIGRIVCCEEQ